MAQRTAIKIGEPVGFSIPLDGNVEGNAFTTMPAFPKLTNKTYFSFDNIPPMLYENGIQPLHNRGISHLSYQSQGKPLVYQGKAKTVSPIPEGGSAMANVNPSMDAATVQAIVDTWNPIVNTGTGERLFDNYFNAGSIAYYNFEHTSYWWNDIVRLKMLEINNRADSLGTKTCQWGLKGLTPQLQVAQKSHAFYNAFFADPLWRYDYIQGSNPAQYQGSPATEVVNNLIYNGGFHISIAQNYQLPAYDQKQLYNILMEHKMTKAVMKAALIQNPARRNIESFIFNWMEQEPVGISQLDENGNFDFSLGFPRLDDVAQDGSINRRRRTKQPVSCMWTYNNTLLLAIVDGIGTFGLGNFTTNDSNKTNNKTTDGLFIDNNANFEIGTKNQESLNGQNFTVHYEPKYYGNLNYIYLALWQLSQPVPKLIIEDTTTEWNDAVFRVTVGGVNIQRIAPFNRVDYNAEFNEPVVQIKYDSTGTKCLIYCCNPTLGLVQQTVEVTLNNGDTTSIVLTSGWAELQYLENLQIV